MKKKDLDRFTTRLNLEKMRIVNQTQISRERDLSVSAEDLSDEFDHASSSLNQNIVLRLRDRDRHLLQKIEIALSRIAQGDFGTCLDCEEEIELKRLEARPVADLCIRCKESEERSERVYA